MSTPLPAQEIAGRIAKTLGQGTFAAGDPATLITGIATTFVPSLDVLQRAVNAGKNLIITRESPTWGRNAKQMEANPLFAKKQVFIAANKLAIYRLRDPWDGYQTGLAKSLGWDKYKNEGIYYQLPPVTLADLAKQTKLQAVRVIGTPRTKVAKAALTHGMITTPDLAKVLKEPGVDAVVIGEPVEWEASTYFQDLIAMGQAKGLIVLGLQASEEPGAVEMASWLTSFIPELPTECIRAGSPFAARRWA